MGICASKAAAQADDQAPTTAATAQPSKGALIPLPEVDTQLPLAKSFLGGTRADDVAEVYDIGPILGAGKFGVTRLVTHKGSGKRYACKSISKAGSLTDAEAAGVRQELQILHHLQGHPNIVNVVGAYEDHCSIHLVMELCAGGDLVDSVISRGQYSERDAAGAIRKILEVVAYCHDIGVVHRDLKLDNMLMADESQDAAALRACDFGLSTFFTPGKPLDEVCGTAFYIAPEILMASYDNKCDVWAVGVILYILLSGRPPFDHVHDEDIWRDIMERGTPDMTGGSWDAVSAGAKECVSLMMTWDAVKRPSARQMLQHEWVCEGGTAGDQQLVPEVVQRLRDFAASNQLKRRALLFMAEHMSEDEVKGLRELFASMDTDNSGTVTYDELRAGMAARNMAIPDDLLAGIMASADMDGSAALDYSEFVGATLHVCKLQREERLVEAFKHFDTDGDGFITRAELEAAFVSGALVDAAALAADVAAVLEQTDHNHDGAIDYAEFRAMMTHGGLDGAAGGAAGPDKQQPQQPQRSVSRGNSSAAAFAAKWKAERSASQRDQAAVAVGA